jgi:hypothetical protein
MSFRFHLLIKRRLKTDSFLGRAHVKHQPYIILPFTLKSHDTFNSFVKQESSFPTVYKGWSVHHLLISANQAMNPVNLPQRITKVLLNTPEEPVRPPRWSLLGLAVQEGAGSLQSSQDIKDGLLVLDKVHPYYPRLSSSLRLFSCDLVRSGLDFSSQIDLFRLSISVTRTFFVVRFYSDLTFVLVNE